MEFTLLQCPLASLLACWLACLYANQQPGPGRHSRNPGPYQELGSSRNSPVVLVVQEWDVASGIQVVHWASSPTLGSPGSTEEAPFCFSQLPTQGQGPPSGSYWSFHELGARPVRLVGSFNVWGLSANPQNPAILHRETV